MPSSMTAFARIAAQHDWGSLVWEIRSGNHRYLETGFRLPETLRAMEMTLRETTRQLLQRGKVDCNLQLVLNLDQEGISVNLEMASQFVNAAEQVAGLMEDPSPLSPLEVLKWPGVVEQRQIDSDLLQAETLSLFRQALAELERSRRREGEKLQLFIEQRLDALSTETAKVREILPQILSQQQQKIRDRLRELSLELNPERLEQEIVLLAQKADVDEELDRLDAHVQEIRRVLNGKGAIGRRLDFLMQELNREANTLSSKSLATDTTQIAVELKVLIEQMREQIQNIE